MLCMNCKTSELVSPPDEHPSYVECPNCRAIELTYKPFDYQEGLHSVPITINSRGEPEPQIIFVAGGYGSGKSRSSLQEFFLRCLENPKATALITANTISQLRRTTIKTLINEIIPPPLITKYNQTSMEIVLINGTVIYAIPTEDEERIRSLNAGLIHCEEISGIDYSIYAQLLTRMRDSNTKVKTLFACTNPDSGWVRDVFAMNDSRKDPNHPEHQRYNRFIHSFIWKTSLNKALPSNYIEMVSAGKADWWIKKYIEGSFEASEGAVYPNFGKCIIPPMPVTENTDKYGIPKHWERFTGMDWGMRNPTAVVFGAINPETGETFIYNEYYAPNRLLPEHAKHLKPMIDEIPHGLMRFMVADPSTKNRNSDVLQGKSVQSLFQEYGMFFQLGNNSIEAGILRVNSYIERGKLKIYSTCVNTCREMINYRFKELDLDSDKNLDEKPDKKNEHSCDALRYAYMRLPEDPELLKADAYAPPRKWRSPANMWDDDYESTTTKGDWMSYV